jgi:uncharacterized protein
MIIDIRTVAQGHTTLSRTTRLESVKTEMPPLNGDIQCWADIDRIGDTFYCHVMVECVVRLECSRCLTAFDCPVSGELSVVIKESPDRRNPTVSDTDSVDFYYTTQDTEVDIGSAIFDEIMTAVPLKPLCSIDCKGIAVDDPDILIDDMSAEKKEEIDPRWATLLKLKEKRKKQ